MNNHPLSVPPPQSTLDRRAFLATAGAALSLTEGLRAGYRPRLVPRPVPSASQLLWQRDELALFLHFGVNTFSDREWGDGTEAPASFAPTALDARQWARTARAAGFRTLILTAKHHDGFCLWPTRTTSHSVKQSAWRSGSGDVVREFTDACAQEGLRAGLYCSPWDRNAESYGDSERYNALYVDQLTELLTGYGPIHEFWFDGANGEGPNRRRQAYDWPRFFSLVHRLQPEAVIFSDAGPDLRWIGNEKGEAGDPNWSRVDPTRVPFPGAEGPGIIDALLHGDPTGSVWRPGETDTSIRPGWFYHPAEDDKVRTVEELTSLYFTSVGRNSKLLLNVPPTREGLLHPVDVSRLQGFRSSREGMFQHDLLAGQSLQWRRLGPRSALGQIGWSSPVTISLIDLREEIERGQRVARYTVEGLDNRTWRVLSRGTTIGCRKLDRCEAIAVRHLRIRIDEAVDAPVPLTVALYGPA